MKFSPKGIAPLLVIIYFLTFLDFSHKSLLIHTLPVTLQAYKYVLSVLFLLPILFIFGPVGTYISSSSKTTSLKISALLNLFLFLLNYVCCQYNLWTGVLVISLAVTIVNFVITIALFSLIRECFAKSDISYINSDLYITKILALLSAFIYYQGVFRHPGLLPSFSYTPWVYIISASMLVIGTYLLPISDFYSNESKTFNYFKLFNHLRIFKLVQDSSLFPTVVGASIVCGILQSLLLFSGLFSSYDVSIFNASFFVILALGAIFGAIYFKNVTNHHVELGFIPISLLGLTLIFFISPFIQNFIVTSILALACGVFASLVIIPLFTLIQINSHKKKLVSFLNVFFVLTNVVSLISLTLISVLMALGIDLYVLSLGLGVAFICTSIYILYNLPQSLIRLCLYATVSKFYQLSVYQPENLPAKGGVLLLGNHTSLIDWAILQLASPRPIRFVMERSVYEKWYLKWLLSKFKIIPIVHDLHSDSIEAIRTALASGQVVAIFPENRLSRNGQIGTFYSGFEKTALNTKASIVPFYIHGLWGAKNSNALEHYKDLKKINNKKINVIFGPPLKDDVEAHVVRQKVCELSIKSWKNYTSELDNIQTEWFNMAKRKGNEICLIDSSGSRFSAHKLCAAVIYFVNALKPHFESEQNIGIILPASAAGVIANLAVFCRGKTVVNLNYTAGVDSILSAIEQAKIKKIISSHVFLEKLSEKGFNLAFLQDHCRVLHLEDFKKKTAKVSIARNLLAVKLLPAFLLRRLFIVNSDVNSVAAILFSSGSEGNPKGIELTHRNLLSNIKQVTSVFAIQEEDVMLNSLPLFHAFGLTMTTLVPLLQGFGMVCYPDPTNALGISRLIYNHRITLICATSTFLNLYNRNQKIHPLLLSSLRLVISGAEKLSPQVAMEFKKKFNHDIYEGYGATEVAPVASCNFPDVISASDWQIYQGNKPGTVGIALPGSAFRIVDPITLKDLPLGEDGLILIGGTQVMRGYLNDPERTKNVLIQDSDIIWYKTGDKGHLDEDGYLTIVDRYSRFAKIGGEMISLGLVEQYITNVLNDPELEVIALAIPHDRKGEAIAVFFSSHLSIDVVESALKASDMPRLMLPYKIVKVESIPKLASGKKDYHSAKQLLHVDELNLINS